MAEMNSISNGELRSQSNKLRIMMLKSAHKAGGGHLGGAFSVIDLLLFLYSQVLNLDPSNPILPGRDRLILSKGHSCLALYACMEEFGFLDRGEIMTFLEKDSRLAGHSEHFILPGVEITTGSLGHGLGISAGIALAGKKNKESWKVFCILGDGECNEGSVWETLLFIRQHNLNNVVTIIDYNKQESLDRTENILSIDPLSKKIEAFGLIPIEIDGHSFDEIRSAVNAALLSEIPVVIVANTVKGFGVDFMEGVTKWHYRGPSKEELWAAETQLKVIK